MHLDLVYHPRELDGRDLTDVCCVVLDVLRATTTMVNALANGAAEIRVFGELEEARAAHSGFAGPKLLAGERGCLRPEGFDLGNSPASFTSTRVDGKTIFMSTTNGTRAVHSCRRADQTIVAALVNASLAAQQLLRIRKEVIFVCAGVDGAPGGEDVDGAATIADTLCRLDPAITVSRAMSDEIGRCSWLAPWLDRSTRLQNSPGGMNLKRAGLASDIDFAAALDSVGRVGRVFFEGPHAIIRTAH